MLPVSLHVHSYTSKGGFTNTGQIAGLLNSSYF